MTRNSPAEGSHCSFLLELALHLSQRIINNSSSDTPPSDAAIVPLLVCHIPESFSPLLIPAKGNNILMSAACWTEHESPIHLTDSPDDCTTILQRLPDRMSFPSSDVEPDPFFAR